MRSARRSSRTCTPPPAVATRHGTAVPTAPSSLTRSEAFTPTLCLFPCVNSTRRLSGASVKALSSSISVTTAARVESDTGSNDVIAESVWECLRCNSFLSRRHTSKQTELAGSAPKTNDAANQRAKSNQGATPNSMTESGLVAKQQLRHKRTRCEAQEVSTLDRRWNRLPTAVFQYRTLDAQRFHDQEIQHPYADVHHSYESLGTQNIPQRDNSSLPKTSRNAVGTMAAPTWK